MANIGLNKHLSQEKIPEIFIKRKVFITFEKVTGDNLKIEIPISKITGATHNKDNRVNKLVTVFATSSCYQDRAGKGGEPGLPPVHLEELVNGDKNQLEFYIVPRHCSFALSLMHCNADINQHALGFNGRHSLARFGGTIQGKNRAVLRSTTPLKAEEPDSGTLLAGFGRLSTVY